jgi:hypothetical protein
MEFFLIDPNIERLPPTDTRLLDLRGDPYPDGKRLRVALEITPFLKRPSIELTLTDPSGEQAALASVIEPMAWKLELTLHNRIPDPVAGTYNLTATLTYPDLGEVDRRSLSILFPTPTDQP